jgi:putative glutamine amidotransferase
MRGPLVVITSIPRAVQTSLGFPMDNATIHHGFASLVLAAGGIPVATDSWASPEDLVDRVDAVVINGGSDVDPSRYGASALETTDPPDHRRDAFEIGLVQAARARGVPVLGVCRGMQLLNVACGGTLVQQLPETEIEHYNVSAYDRPAHLIEADAGSWIADAMGAGTVEVNTLHHQAVDRLGNGLRASARAPDGTIEAIEDDSALLIGIQWHPEFLVDPRSGKDAGPPEQVGIFRALLRSGILRRAGADS